MFNFLCYFDPSRLAKIKYAKRGSAKILVIQIFSHTEKRIFNWVEFLFNKKETYQRNYVNIGLFANFFFMSLKSQILDNNGVW